MKKLINHPSAVVPEMLKGLVRTSPGLRLVPDSNVILREAPTVDVALISGGGAGHEPAHAGFVGHRRWAKHLRGSRSGGPRRRRSNCKHGPAPWSLSYLGDHTAGHGDPGAEAVAIWLGALAASAT